MAGVRDLKASKSEIYPRSIRGLAHPGHTPTVRSMRDRHLIPGDLIDLDYVGKGTRRATVTSVQALTGPNALAAVEIVAGPKRRERTYVNANPAQDRTWRRVEP